ncbi:MAG: hypothetical protein D6732_09425 [Methanobacteriota archaeon]|nr:MAG: hypothetical protein D6732_09425 [Euryarchaeota archaeon]
MIEIPSHWKEIDVSQLRGVILILGGTDSGKSTFAHYLFERCCQTGHSVAFLDGDPGQSVLGPPTTLTMATPVEGEKTFPPSGNQKRWFIRSNSPVGHMLPMIVGYSRLVHAARRMGARTIICDTTGLIDVHKGGHYLKLAKIELLTPSFIFAFQKEDELEPILHPLKKSRRVNIKQMMISEKVEARDLPLRQAYRAEQFAKYFSEAKNISFFWNNLAVFPRPFFQLYQIIALRDKAGFTLGLGIVTEVNPTIRQLTILTPLPNLKGVNSLETGDLLVDPHTFMDQPLGGIG